MKTHRKFIPRMSDEPQTWIRIRANRLKLRDEFNVDGDELLRSLSDKAVFTLHEEKRIRAITDPTMRFDELFHILFNKNPQKYFDVVLEALDHIGRQDAVIFLQGGRNTSDSPCDAQFVLLILLLDFPKVG
ncbi:unnamed protein product [Darwinula stevensoni]|uniref:CARD domain-containing protein n=1 Tax=Darwinula stevensoni TaxID=69355 RepID=A0A7R8XDD8_9CRUS|nr:unnamed protein product [Darwinula stevensoni]CAG0894640.1 unnamed protein product [Darwinula stevensoni]